MLTEEALTAIHDELRRQLAQHRAALDAVYYCPFHPEGVVEKYAEESDLRKPKPGMLLAAGRDMDIDLSASWMVGDSAPGTSRRASGPAAARFAFACRRGRGARGGG